MSKKNDGGPAFPIASYDHQTFNPRTVEESKQLLSGMSLRAYLAANLQIDCKDVSTGMALAVTGFALPSACLDPVGHATAMARYRARMRLIEADALIAELERDQ